MTLWKLALFVLVGALLWLGIFETMLWIGNALAQENPPIELTVPYVGEHFTGCPPLPDRGVTCWAYGRFPTVPERGPRFASFCHYDGTGYWAPRGTGWWGCPSSAPPGIACNASIYLVDSTRWWRPKVYCDAGQADGTDWP